MHAGLQAQLLSAFGQGTRAYESPLDACANTQAFVDHYNLKIDGMPFRWGLDGYAHMVEVYQDNHPKMSLMAAAQTGKSGYVIAKLGRALVEHWGSMFGYYFPDALLPGVFSEKRFAPFLKGNPDLRPFVGKKTDDGFAGADRTTARSLGPSVVYFLTIMGKTSTEGMPLKGVFFDEVRRMTYHAIQLAEERTSAQVNPMDVKVSTAKFPDSDIHLHFKRGDQRYFHSDCRCSNGVVLSRLGPDCYIDLRKASPAIIRKVEHQFSHDGVPYLGLTGEDVDEYKAFHAAFRCPKCDKIITNPRRGWWEAEVPSNYAHSYQLPQMLTPTYNAPRIQQKIDKPEEPVSVQEIWNSVFGLPFLDPDLQPVKLHHLEACVDLQLRWGANMTDKARRKYMVNCCLGMDCQGGYNVVVIKKRSDRGGKWRTVHLEIVYGDDPWKRCARLMYEYDVRFAVIDQMPHWNEALRFAKKFPGRVYLASYTGGDNDGTDMVTWGDVGKKPQQKGETRMRHKVSIHRTKGLDWSLNRWVRRLNETPHPNRLLQKLPVQGTVELERGHPVDRVMLTPGLLAGEWQPVPICRNVYWLHQMRVAFEDRYDDETKEANKQRKEEGKKKMVAVHIGLDPHFAHAELYCNVAMSRLANPKLAKE